MEENGQLLLCSQQAMPSMSSSMDSSQVCHSISCSTTESEQELIVVFDSGFKFSICLDSNLNIITGSAFGTREQTHFTFTGPVNLHAGINRIALLSIAVGLQVSALPSSTFR